MNSGPKFGAKIRQKIIYYFKKNCVVLFGEMGGGGAKSSEICYISTIDGAISIWVLIGSGCG